MVQALGGFHWHELGSKICFLFLKDHLWLSKWKATSLRERKAMYQVITERDNSLEELSKKALLWKVYWTYWSWYKKLRVLSNSLAFFFLLNLNNNSIFQAASWELDATLHHCPNLQHNLYEAIFILVSCVPFKQSRGQISSYGI